MNNIQADDIVQITDRSHAWFPCLLIVSEVKAWGVQAYVLIPQSNDSSELPSRAFNRLPFDKIEKVGSALVVSE